MSDAKLQEIVENDRAQECIEFFRSMPEAERRRHAPQCLQLLKQQKKNEAKLVTAEAAVLATGTWTELKAVSWRVTRSEDLVVAIVADRRPEWAAAWIDKLLQESRYWFHWSVARQLVRAKVIPKPTTPNYFLAMISGLVGGRFVRDESVEKHLLADPELLEDEIWRLFEYEGGGENSLANNDHYGRSESWQAAFLSLIAKKRLSRERLLSCSLDALERDFNHYRARWFASFHDALAPSEEEFVENALRYLRLVGASAPNIATWALEIVGKLAAQGTYETASLIAGLQPALTSRNKATAKQALLLLGSAASSPPAQREVIRAAAAALGHEATDVQKAAIDLIDKHAAAVDADLAATIAGYSKLVAASLRKRLERWSTAQTKESTAKTGKSDKKSAAKTSGKATKATKLSPEQIRLWSIDALEANIAAGRTEIPAAIFDGTDIPRLKYVEPLTPIKDLEELIDVCARIVEDEELVDDAERAMDGLSRLCDQKPADFAARTGPLVKRTLQRMKRDVAPFLGNGPGDDLCGLICAWTTGKVIRWKRDNKRGVVAEFPDGEHGWWDENLKKGLGFLSKRSIPLAERVARGQPAVLLSAPTHTGGWIAPEVFVERVNEWSGAEPDVTDICLALLRLAPDGRAEALAKLHDSKQEWVRAVRYALGAPKITIGETAALWIAAARSRAPWADDERIEKAFPEQGPDAGQAATITLKFKKEDSWIKLKVESKPPVPKAADADLVTVTLHHQRRIGRHLGWELGGSSGRTVGSVRWSATIWPIARESLFAASLETIAENLDWWEVAWQNKSLLEPLLDRGTPLREMGLMLLLTALAAKEPGEYGLATDIAIRAIEDGRLGSDNLGRGLAFLLPTGFIKPARWQKTLTDVARASPVHGLVIQVALQTAFRGAPEKLPRDFGKLLELLLELSSELELSIGDGQCREFLQKCSSGKTGKTAKALLQLKPTDFAGVVRPILSQAIEQRSQ